jgi:hypothetical protein
MPQLNYGGEIDGVGIWKKKHLIFDIKTGKENDWHKDQLVLYRQMMLGWAKRNIATPPKDYALGNIYIDLQGARLVVHKEKDLDTPAKVVAKVTEDHKTSLPPGVPLDDLVLERTEDHEYFLVLPRADDLGTLRIHIPGVSALLTLGRRRRAYKDTPGGPPPPLAVFGKTLHAWIEAAHSAEIQRDIDDLPEGDQKDVLLRYLGHYRDCIKREGIKVWRHEIMLWGSIS